MDRSVENRYRNQSLANPKPSITRQGRSLGISLGIVAISDVQTAIADPGWDPRDVIQQIKNQAATAADRLTDQVLNRVTEQVQTSLVDQTVRKAGDLSSSILDSLVQKGTTALDVWVSQHRIAGWLVTHPLWSFIALVLTISLVWTLITLAGRLLQRTWLMILAAPFLGLWWLIKQLFRWLRGAIAQAETAPTGHPAENRVADILRRLEHLRQEQETLMQELTTLIDPRYEREKEPR